MVHTIHLSTEEINFLLASLDKVSYSGAKTAQMLVSLTSKLNEVIKPVERPKENGSER